MAVNRRALSELEFEDLAEFPGPRGAKRAIPPDEVVKTEDGGGLDARAAPRGIDLLELNDIGIPRFLLNKPSEFATRNIAHRPPEPLEARTKARRLGSHIHHLHVEIRRRVPGNRKPLARRQNADVDSMGPESTHHGQQQTPRTSTFGQRRLMRDNQRPNRSFSHSPRTRRYAWTTSAAILGHVNAAALSRPARANRRRRSSSSSRLAMDVAIASASSTGTSAAWPAVSSRTEGRSVAMTGAPALIASRHVMPKPSARLA